MIWVSNRPRFMCCWVPGCRPFSLRPLLFPTKPSVNGFWTRLTRMPCVTPLPTGYKIMWRPPTRVNCDRQTATLHRSKEKPMSFETIIFTKENHIALIQFNRPKALNALNNQLFDELDQALDQVEADPDIRVLVLTGAGDKAFVAGADIVELSRMTPLQGKYFSRKGQNVFAKIENLPIPAIAAVNGYALGGGPRRPWPVILSMHLKMPCSGCRKSIWA
jgi:hypothetical protein